MDWSIIVLILILFALWSIKSTLDRIGNEIANKPTPVSSFPSLSGIEEHLKNIYLLMGGDEKLIQENSKKHKDLKARFKNILVKQGMTEKQAEEEADKRIEEAEFAESHEGYQFNWGHNFHGLENSVNRYEIEERYKHKYGHLLEKARDYLKGKTIILPKEMKLQEAIETDYYGEKWLLEKLIEEKRIKKNVKYDYSENTNELINYEVLQS